MNMKVVGGTLIIVGTSIGGGILALPVALAQSGFLGALVLIFGSWALMTCGAFLILEANLWFPENSNLISMAKATLGKPGAYVTWISCLLLLYSLLSAYIAGGSDVLTYLLQLIGIHIHGWITSLVFVGILSAIVYRGIKSIDYVNRGLMFVKLSSLLLLMILISPNTNFQQLDAIRDQYLVSAITIVITSFGFAVVIPSLRAYFKSNVKQLRLAIFAGSMIPLFFYIAWVGLVLAIIPLHGRHGLLEALQSGHAISFLTRSLILFAHNPWLTTFARIFSSICVATSFLGVALSLSDFLADGFSLKNKAHEKLIVYAATFIPPFALVLFYPKAFIMALGYAGIFCTVLLVLMPALTVWNGRYYKSISGKYKVMGGKATLACVIIASSAIILHELFIVLKFLL